MNLNSTGLGLGRFWPIFLQNDKTRRRGCEFELIAPALMTKTGGWARARSRSRRGAGPFSAASEEGGVSIRDEGQPTPHESVGCSR